MEVANGRRLNDAQAEVERLSTTLRHLRTLRKLGMPVVRLAGKIRYDPVEVDAWLESQQRQHRQRQRVS